ncbi:cell wall protein Cwp1p [Monosporozyma servazzii]
MQFTKITVATFIALSKLVSADSESFGLVSSHSASAAHLLSVLDKDGLYLTSGSDMFSAVVTDAGKLKFSNGKYAVIGDDGKWTEGSESDGAAGFAVSQGGVTYQGSRSFYAVPTGEAGKYEVSEKNADGAIGVSLMAFTPTGSRAADFTPSEGADASAATTKAASTTTAAAATTASKPTVGAISQITDGQIQNAKTVEVQSENGVAKVAMNGAGAIAAAVALLM